MMQNEAVEVELVRLMKTTPENAYQAWIVPVHMKNWWMTSPTTNTAIHSDAVEGGTYEIRDRVRDKERVVKGTIEQLISHEHVQLTIQMPAVSEESDFIDVHFEERSPGITQMTFRYQTVFEKPRHMSNLVYKQEKKAYHDHTAHAFELMFDTLQAYLERDND